MLYKLNKHFAIKWAFIAIPFFLLFLGNCKHEPIAKKIIGTTDTTGNWQNPNDTVICFERDILPIFVSNCAKAGCHDAITHEEDLVLTNYNNIRNAGIKPGNPNGSSMFVNLNTGKMSQAKYGNLSQSQKDYIRRWIWQGAKNGTNCPVKCDTAKYTFSGAINPMIQNLCVGCHKPGSISGGTDLSTHAGVAASANSGKLMSSLKRTSNWMPSGGQKLSDCQLTQIQKWIDAGTPNN